MIDPHVHFRDWNQSHKETVAHGLSVAERVGLDAVFEMPNTDPPMTTESRIKQRLLLADNAGVPVFHGVYGGLTTDPEQIRKMVKTWQDLFPRVVGLKLFAGRSTGDLSIVSSKDQENVIQILAAEGFSGVLAVHCEKEVLFQKKYYDPDMPFNHTLYRPPESEVESIKDIISFAENADFKGTLHICHISTEKSFREVEKVKREGSISITCGLTPHHALLYDELMKTKNGNQLKMNPPLRFREIQEKMLELLVQGRIDWIETDHAPHLLIEKRNASGIPGLPFYPHFIQRLKALGVSTQQIKQLTHSSICDTFHIKIDDSGKAPDYDLEKEYEFDPFKDFRIF